MKANRLPQILTRRSAWLVLWQSAHKEYLEKLKLRAFVCALPSNLNERSVRMLLKAFWTVWMQETLEEKVGLGCCLRWPKSLVRPHPCGGPVSVGDDPILWARRVRDLRVVQNESGREDVYFVIPAEDNIPPGGARRSGNTPGHPMVLKHGQWSPQAVSAT
jgi:hypothetical protein